MAWIQIKKPGPDEPALTEALKEAVAGYPAEYGPDRRGERRLPPDVASESIVMSHSLIPTALKHFFAGYAALLSPDLPLERRQHEMIATVVSVHNRCFY